MTAVPAGSHRPEAAIGWSNPRLHGRIRELDGFRGMAILLVLLWHYFFNVLDPQTASGWTWWHYVIGLGRLTWTGVDLFFVLSGFLIGGILYDAKESPRFFTTFYARRACRIFPVYFIWLAVFAVAVWAAARPRNAAVGELFSRQLPLWTYPLFLQNISMFLHQSFGAVWLGVTWSLAVEEQFYLLLPILIWSLARRRVQWIPVVAVILAVTTRLWLWRAGDVYGMYTLLPARADALGVGVGLAILVRNENAWLWLRDNRLAVRLVFWTLAIGVAIFSVLPGRAVFVVGLTWIAAFYGTLLLLAIVHGTAAEVQWATKRTMVHLGAIAYPVYIVHQGLNGLLHAAFFADVPLVKDVPTVAVTLLSLVCSLSIGTMSWHLLESRLIGWAHRRWRYRT